MTGDAGPRTPAAGGAYRRGPWLLFVCALATCWAGNGRTALFDRDEPRYAGTALRMAETGDWIVPYFNGQFRFQKPPLTYWLIALSTRVFGADEFGVRAASGICLAWASVLVWRAGDRLYGPPAGALAGTMFALAPLPAALGKLAVPDAPLMLCSAACVSMLHCCWRGRADFDPRSARRAARWFWLALAASLLIKGPILVGLIAAFFLAFRLLAKEGPSRFALSWRTGPIVFAALAGPWFAMVAYATGGEFFREAVGHQLLERMRVSFDRRYLPPGYYPGTAVFLFAPWAGYVALTLVRGGRDWRQAGPTGFLAAWCLGSAALLEAFQSKQSHYWAPAYPALALLGAGELARLWRGAAAWRTGFVARATATWHAAVGLGWAAVLAIFARTLPAAAAPALWWSAAALAGAGLGAAFLWLRAAPRAAFALQAAGQAATALLVALGALPGWETERLPRPLAAALAGQREGRIAVLDEYEPSLAYYSGRIVVALRRGAAPPEAQCVANDAERAELERDGAWAVERSFRGWHKNHAETVHLLRRRDALAERATVTSRR